MDTRKLTSYFLWKPLQGERAHRNESETWFAFKFAYFSSIYPLVSAQHHHPRGNGSYLPHGRGGGPSTADLGAATLATAGSCSVVTMPVAVPSLPSTSSLPMSADRSTAVLGGTPMHTPSLSSDSPPKGARARVLHEPVVVALALLDAFRARPAAI